MKTYLLKNNITGDAAVYPSSLELGVENGCLKAHFICEHSSMFSASSQYNGDLFNGDVVELFIYTGIKDHYLEVEVSPNNTHFVGDIFNDGKTRVLTLSDKDIMTTSVVKTAKGYEAFISISMEDLGCSIETIRLNAFRIDTDNGIPDAHLFALNPTMCSSFHCREYLLTGVD